MIFLSSKSVRNAESRMGQKHPLNTWMSGKTGNGYTVLYEKGLAGVWPSCSYEYSTRTVLYS